MPQTRPRDLVDVINDFFVADAPLDFLKFVNSEISWTASFLEARKDLTTSKLIVFFSHVLKNYRPNAVTAGNVRFFAEECVKDFTKKKEMAAGFYIALIRSKEQIVPILKYAGMASMLTDYFSDTARARSIRQELEANLEAGFIQRTAAEMASLAADFNVQYDARLVRLMAISPAVLSAFCSLDADSKGTLITTLIHTDLIKLNLSASDFPAQVDTLLKLIGSCLDGDLAHESRSRLFDAALKLSVTDRYLANNALGVNLFDAINLHKPTITDEGLVRWEILSHLNHLNHQVSVKRPEAMQTKLDSMSIKNPYKTHPKACQKVPRPDLLAGAMGVLGADFEKIKPKIMHRAISNAMGA